MCADRRNALSHEIGGELQELDAMLAEMSKEVDMAKGREKSDWQSGRIAYTIIF